MCKCKVLTTPPASLLLLPSLHAQRFGDSLISPQQRNSNE
jgi:hypothetical protein